MAAHCHVHFSEYCLEHSHLEYLGRSKEKVSQNGDFNHYLFDFVSSDIHHALGHGGKRSRYHSNERVFDICIQQENRLLDLRGLP